MHETKVFRSWVNRKARWLDGVVLRGAWALLRAKLEDSLKVNAARIYQLGSFRHAILRHVEIEIGRDLGSPRDTLDQLQALEYLSFGSSRSPYLPHSFKQHGALKHLILGRYRSAALPDNMRDVQALEHLDLWGYRLKSLPDILGQLGALKSLTIGGYCLETIPNSLGQLSALESLPLRYCFQLRALPSTVGELSSLKSLELSGLNPRLEALPSTLGQLRALKVCQYLNAGDCERCLIA